MMSRYNEKEKKIFAAVLALADRGVDMRTVKMQEIAAEADIGKSTLYEYFTSKEELLLATVSYCLETEIGLLSPKLQTCQSFSCLVNELFAYIAGLVQERAAAYGMVAQVFSGSNPAEACPVMGKVQQAIASLLDFAGKLALQDGLAAGEKEYFDHVFLSALIGHATTVLRMKNFGQLSAEELQKLERLTVKMLLNSLR